MKMEWRITLVLLAGLAVPALAQDSTSLSTMFGDAPEPTDATEQVNTYVVDTQELISSWGNSFRVAPVIKAGKSGFQYCNMMLSAPAISNTMLTNVPFANSSYTYWTQPTGGVHFYNNNASANQPPISGVGRTGQQFGLGFADYGYAQSSGASCNSIVGGVVNVDPADPFRLYVTRVTAAVNLLDVYGSGFDRSQFGMGSIDSDGFVSFRADRFNVGDPNNAIYGDNYIRTDLLARTNGTLNLVDFDGPNDTASSDWILKASTVTSSPPTMLPTQLGGPLMLGTNYNGQYIYENPAISDPNDANRMLETTANRGTGVSDQRGCISISTHLACGNRVATCGILGKVGSLTTAMNLWGIDTLGQVVPGSPIALDPRSALGITGAFDGYHGNHGFRGGNGLIAIGKDALGNGLAAATWYYAGTATDVQNAIVVARFNCADSNPANAQWTIAAKTRLDGTSTPVLDGPNGTQIATLAPAVTGPSMSAPAFDAAGNVYFLSDLAFPDPNYPSQTRYAYGLVRGVLNPATFTYQLELLVEQAHRVSTDSSSPDYYNYTGGTLFHGQNSNRDYRITYLTVAYASGLSSDSFFSGSTLPETVDGSDVTTLDVGSPAALGGLVFNANIVYDVNGDGVFTKKDATANPPDEAYSVLMFVRGTAAVPQGCPGDYDCDNDRDFDDIKFLVAALGGEATWSQYHVSHLGVPPTCDYLASCDADGSGAVDFDDIKPFVRLIGVTCP